MKTTKQQYNFFKTSCEHYIDKLGLHEWHIYYEFRKLKEGAVACTAPTITARVATIVLAISGEPSSLTEENLEKIALEEVLHILLANIACYAGHYCSNDLVTEEEHVIINHLKKAL